MTFLSAIRWLTPPANFRAALRAFRAWCAVAYAFHGLHPDGYEDADSGWPRVLKRALMNFVPGGVAFELREPPFASVRRRRAVRAAAMSVPKAAVDEDNGFVLRQDDVGATG